MNVTFQGVFLFVVASLLLTTIAEKKTKLRDSDTGYFLQISDIHYDSNYSIDGFIDDSCHEVSVSDSATVPLSVWGERNCDSPWNLVYHSLSKMAAKFPDPDFILWTGDTGSHNKETETNMDAMYATIQNVSSVLYEFYRDIPVIVSLGNHDMLPEGTLAVNSSAATQYYQKLLERSGWQNFITEQSQRNEFLHGGYYKSEMRQNLWVLSLNTLIWYKYNNLTGDQPDPENQFIWLGSQLLQAQRENIQVYLCGHIPPGTSYGIWPETRSAMWQDYVDQYNQQLVAIMLEYADTITAAFFGHEHQDTYKVLSDMNGVAKIPVFIASSIVPSGQDPTIRTYTYNRRTTHLQDMTQYYMPLPIASSVPRDEEEPSDPQWVQLYSFCQAYDIDTLDATHINAIINTWQQPHSDKFSVFFKFLHYNQTLEGCDYSCQYSFYCSSKKLLYTEHNACMSATSMSVDSISSGSQVSVAQEHRYLLVVMCIVSMSVVLIVGVVVYAYCKKPKDSRTYSPLPNYIEL